MRTQGDEQLVLNQAATMSLFDTDAPTQKKPSASQQRRFELHTCLRSYSQLTLTQPRHRRKGTRRKKKRTSESSRPFFQPSSEAEGETGRQTGGKSLLKCSLSFILSVFFFFPPSPFLSCFLYYIFFSHLYLFSLCLC